MGNPREVIVTGASGGIGAGIRTVFRAAGWRVIGVDSTPAPSPSDFDAFHHVNLARPESIEGLFGQLGTHSDDLPERDVRCIVNNAAVQITRPVQQTSLSDWDEVMTVNLRAPYLMTRLGLSWLKAAAHASIVNVTSVHARATSPSIAAYAASKGGLDALTRAAALDLAPEGVRVNAVAPGAIDTPMLRAGLMRQADVDADDLLARFAAAQSVGRVGRAEEIGEVVLMLAAPETGGFFNGASLVIDGGATARLSTE